MMPSAIADRLYILVETRDRHRPIAFVGREDELRYLQGAVDAMASRAVEGAMRIVQGAPGTGKTSLCVHFQSQLVNDDALRAAASPQDQEDGAPYAPVLWVDLACADLKKFPLDLVRTISQRAGETLQSALTRPVADKLGMAARPGGALNTSWGLLAQKLFRGKSWDEIREATFGLNERSSLDDCVNAYVDYAWSPNCTIALCLDEAQNCDVDSKQARENLQSLCAGKHRGRLPLLCFGLPDTSDVFGHMGVSRRPNAAVRTLGCLEPGEGLQAIERTLDALGLSVDNHAWAAHLESLGMTDAEWNRWRAQTAAELADASGEFPQHIAVALIALADAMQAMQPGQRFDDSFRRDVLADHEERRIEYYEGRLANVALTNHTIALSAVCELLHRRSARGKTVRAAEACGLLEVIDDLGCPVQDGEPILDAAFAKGVLGKGRVRLAIITPPLIQSMRTYLRDIMCEALLELPEIAQPLVRRVDELEPPLAAEAA